MYVSRTFKATNMQYVQNPNELRILLSEWKTYFSQFIDRYLKIEEVENLIHYVKFKMWPALFYVNSLYSQHFWMLVLGCTLFAPIYTEIEK